MANKHTAFGLAKSEDQARRIVERCRHEGARSEDISLLIADRNNTLTRKAADGRLEPTPEYQARWNGTFAESPGRAAGSRVVGHEKHTKAPEGATAGAITGGAIGAGVGVLAGLGALAIPGLGALVAAGPILAALSGAGAGATVGLIVGALAGLGIPEYEAKKFEAGLKEGQILVAVNAADKEQLARCEKVMKEEGAESVACV